MKNQFIRVSSIPALCVIIKLQDRVVLKDMNNQFMEELSIPAPCVIFKPEHSVILKSISAIIKLQLLKNCIQGHMCKIYGLISDLNTHTNKNRNVMCGFKASTH